MRTICLGLGSSGVARLLFLDVAHLEALDAVEVQQPVVAVVEVEDVLEIVEREVVLEYAEGTLEGFEARYTSFKNQNDAACMDTVTTILQ